MDTDETAEETGSALNAALHSEHWGRHMSQDGHLKRCIVVCRTDDPRPPKRCPSCFGRALSVPQWQAQLEPPPGLAARLGRWAGDWCAAFWLALTYPWRLDQARLRALLEDMMAAGLRAEVVQVCPVCEAAEDGGEEKKS